MRAKFQGRTRRRKKPNEAARNHNYREDTHVLFHPIVFSRFFSFLSSGMRYYYDYNGLYCAPRWNERGNLRFIGFLDKKIDSILFSWWGTKSTKTRGRRNLKSVNNGNHSYSLIESKYITLNQLLLICVNTLIRSTRIQTGMKMTDRNDST